MIVASMTQTVSTPRCGTSSAELAAMAAISQHGEPRDAVDKIAERTLMAGVDLDADAHSGAQERRVLGNIDPQAHGHTLDDLHPVARGVLRRQHRELGARGGGGAGPPRVPLPGRGGGNPFPGRGARPVVGPGRLPWGVHITRM